MEKKASSKNNATTYLVRWGSSAGKGIIFLFVYRDVLIVFVIVGAGISLQCSVIFGLEIQRHQLSQKQCILMFWQIKNNTLAGNFGFVGNKMAIAIVE